MNIGFVNIFSFRPHVEHLYYLSELARRAGHNVFFLTCDSAVSNCYARLLKGTGKLRECSKCIIGGVRSFPTSNVTSIRNQRSSLRHDELEALALSSSCTLARTESELEWNDPEVAQIRQSLYAPIGAVYQSTKRWIESNQLNAVICFNGRMDLTRAVTYACEVLKVPYATHERTWFGDGIQLVPNANCLSLNAVAKMVAEYDKKPLTQQQAAIAGKLAAERFLQRNSLEWRLYNKNPEPASWPLRSKGKRILVIPSSKNEFAGHDEWRSAWVDNTHAIDDFLDVFGIDTSQVVVRAHPNWAEKIGRVNGDRSHNLYNRWACRRNIHFIDSAAKASTYDLIQQADIVLVNSGSSAVEAGVCGKQVICLGPSTYNNASFVQVFNSREEMEDVGVLPDIDPDDVRRKTLRYMYVRSHRFPQFVDFVRACETTSYQYFEGADPNRLIALLTTGELEADDPTVADTEAFEDAVIERLAQTDWDTLASFEEPERCLPPLTLQRRKGFRWVDSVRSKFIRGDLA